MTQPLAGANSILERVHQVLGNMLRTKNLQEYDFDDMDPWSELLGSLAWAIHSTHHTTLQATLGQLVFGSVELRIYVYISIYIYIVIIFIYEFPQIDLNNSQSLE